jgi:hypothetical protein
MGIPIRTGISGDPTQGFIDTPIANFSLLAPFFRYHLVLSLVDTPEKAPPYTLAR